MDLLDHVFLFPQLVDSFTELVVVRHNVVQFLVGLLQFVLMHLDLDLESRSIYLLL